MKEKWMFKDIVNQLKDNGFFNATDAKTAKNIFKTHRTP